jgi:hypothetical protein
VQHERGSGDLAQAIANGRAAGEQPVVLGRGQGRAPIPSAPDDAAHPFHVDGDVTRECAFSLDEVGDDRLAVRPLGRLVAASGELLRQPPAHRRQVGAARAGGDEGQGSDSVGVVHGHVLGDAAAHRDADDVGGGDAEGIQQADDVRDQGFAAVGRCSGRERRGATGVAGVVADDVTLARSEEVAEIVVPPVHRGLGAADEQHGRDARFAEALDAEFDVTDREHLLVMTGHVQHATTPGAIEKSDYLRSKRSLN